MHKDTREELARLEAALLAEESEKLEKSENLEDFLEGLLDEPTDSLQQAGPMVYHNFANGYGKEEEPEPEAEPKADNLSVLMFTAAGLLLGIGAVIIYWVVRFL